MLSASAPAPSVYPPPARAVQPLTRGLMLLATLAILLAGHMTVAEAAVVKRLSLEGLTDDAHAIVRGRIITSESRWEGNVIYTRHQLRIETVLKGNYAAGETVIVSTPGGQVGEVGQLCCGAARFRAAEDVYLFLWHDGEGRLRVFGLGQGKFRVGEADENGVRTVGNSYQGLVTVDPRTLRQVDAEPITVSLAQFEARVRSRVEAGAAGSSDDESEAGN